MLDEADERWIAEHGFGEDNPLLRQIEHACDLLVDNPELGIADRHPGGVVRIARQRSTTVRPERLGRSLLCDEYE